MTFDKLEGADTFWTLKGDTSDMLMVSTPDSGRAHQLQDEKEFK